MVSKSDCGVMEVKVNHRQGSVSLPNRLPSFSFPSPSFSFNRRFRGLAKKWRIQIQEIGNCQNSYKYLLIHVVKQGETLTSISKQYGVSVYSIAAVNNLMDLDLVFEGQHINIPFSAKDENHSSFKSLMSCFDLQEARRQSQNIIRGVLDKTNVTIQTVHSLPRAYRLNYPARTTGYFLVLVPLTALCIGCMIGVFRSRIAGGLKHQTVNKSQGRHHGSKSARWKSALSDIMEHDDKDSEFEPRSSNQTEDQDETSLQEDSSHAYTKLEHEYQKFLSECGMSERGYWRGGSSD